MFLQRKSVLLCGAAAFLAAGCAGTLVDLFNPDFLSVTGATQRAATLPGQAPAILLQVENRTARNIDAFISYRTNGDTVETFTASLPPGLSSGRAVVCPVNEITLGDVSNLTRIGAIVRLGAGTTADAAIEVEPFGVLLKEGANYDCGDAITFTVSPSSQTLSGFQTAAFIQRSGATQ